MKGKDTRAHRSQRQLLELERRLDSRLPIGLCLCFYYSTGTFTSEELQEECGMCEFYRGDPYIGVEGSFH
jgi:hypothetical protein